MRTVGVKLYKFNELRQDIQSQVIERLRNINVDYSEWFDFVYNEWYKKLNGLGFEDCQIYFSGFWSQGDGASFIGKITDFSKFLKDSKYLKLRKLIKNESIELYGTIETINNHYEHKNTKRFSLSCDEIEEIGEDIDPLINELESEIESKRKDLCDEIYKELEDVYWSLVSDESVRETLVATESEFLEGGEDAYF